MYQHKPNSGSMFPNEYKKSENHPDFRGTVAIEITAKMLQEIQESGTTNVNLEISGWKGKTTQGKPRLSIKLSEPYKKETPQPVKQEFDDSFDDDMPF